MAAAALSSVFLGALPCDVYPAELKPRIRSFQARTGSVKTRVTELSMWHMPGVPAHSKSAEEGGLL